MLSLKEIANRIKEGKSFLVITDSDMDGITSGILIRIILKRLNKEFKIILRRHSGLERKYLEKIIKKNKKFEKIILIDSPFNTNDLIEVAKEIKKEIIYIDHHKREIPKEIPENLVWFDVRSYGITNKSCAEIVYRIGKEIFEDFEKYVLIAALGAVGDFMFNDEIKEELRKNYPNVFPDYFTPIFIRLYYLFENYPKKALKYGEYLIDSPEIFFNKLKAMKVKKIYEDENIVAYFSKKGSSYPATVLKGFTKKTVVVFSPAYDNIFEKILGIFGIYKKLVVSVRSYRIDCGLKMSEFAKKYGIQGGGHPEAAGGKIYKRDLWKLIEFLK